MKFIPVSNYDETNWRIGADNLDWVNGQNQDGCSFNVLPARLLDMTYPDYLKYLRSLGAELRGRTGYPYAIFKDKKSCEEVCKSLNKEWNKIKEYVE